MPIQKRQVRRILFVYPEPYFTQSGGIATYLHHAIRAHLDAGREVHLLTWFTPRDALFARPIDSSLLKPLAARDITIVQISDQDILEKNPVGIRGKTVSDLLYPTIARIESEFQPDVIEGSDYQFPLHTYLQQRRCGAHRSHVPVVTFNHGLLKEIYPASALMPSDTAAREAVMEHQVIAWADHVFAPSELACRIVTELRGSATGVALVREPFQTDTWQTRASFDARTFIYFGRVSFAKGVDIFASMMTAIANRWPVDKITFLGRQERMPFRRSDATEFLKARLHPDLRAKARFIGHLPRDAAIENVAGHEFFANFSRSETFSYTTLEAIARGVVPLVLADSPMAELLPPDVRQHGTFAEPPHRAERIVNVLAYWRDNFGPALRSAQEHARALTDPRLYAAAYQGLERSLPDQPTSRSPYSGSDVTILMCTHNDADLAVNAVASVKRQSIPISEILVLDDGSTDPVKCRILDDMAARGDIRLIRSPNMGLVAGRNLLVENARTDLVVFLDADDLLEPTYVEKTLLAMNTLPDRLSAVMTRRKNFGLNDHETTCDLIGTPLHWVLNDLRMTALIKRSVLARLPFDPLIRNGEADDWWWWLRFSLHGYEAVQVPEALFRYRTAAVSMSLPWSEGQGALTVGLLKKALREAAQSPTVSRDRLMAIAEQGLAFAYKRAWEAEASRSQLAAATLGGAPGSGLPNAMADPFAVSRRARARRMAGAVIGERSLAYLMRTGRRVICRSPKLASLAQAVLHAFGLVRQRG